MPDKNSISRRKLIKTGFALFAASAVFSLPFKLPENNNGTETAKASAFETEREKYIKVFNPSAKN
ncbi:MAG: hypothetical protein LWY06_09440 [Firmicutes bacterium]|nr:hypothetical protein [Bacillota bacterium]